MLGEVLTAAVTPFDSRGAIDVRKFIELCTFLVDNGSDGIVVAGTTGESPTLTDEERLTLFAAAVDAVGDRATVVAGTGTYSTAHSVHLTEKAHELGVDGFLVVTPYYNKPPQRAIVEHFKTIAEASDKPIVVYNIPARVVINIEPETIAELAEIPNVVAVKQANDDLDQARKIVDLGLDALRGRRQPRPAVPRAGRRTAASACTRTSSDRRSRSRCARSRRATPNAPGPSTVSSTRPTRSSRSSTNPIAIKCALNLLGHEVGGLRLPLVEATEEERERIRGCLERLELLEPARV